MVLNIYNLLNTLKEAGIIQAENGRHPRKVIIRPPNEIADSIEDLNLFHRALLPSKVNPNKSILAREQKLCRSFLYRFGIMVRELRETGKVNQENFSKLKNICRDSEFDFLMKISKQQSTVGIPLYMILDFAQHDPDSSINKELRPYIDEETGEKINEYRRQCQEQEGIICINAVSKESLERIDTPKEYIELTIPPNRSQKYAQTATELSIELLEIAKQKHTEFNAAEMGHPLADSIENLAIADWFIANSHSVSEETTSLKDFKINPRNISKLKALLDSTIDFKNPNQNQYIGPNYKKERLQAIEKYFCEALIHEEEFDGTDLHDPVTLLISSHYKLPEEFIMRLLNYADSKGYDFKNSRRKHENYLLHNLLFLAASQPFAEFFIPSTKVVKFLLDKGVNPFETLDEDITMGPTINREFIGSLAEALDSGKIQKVVDCLSGKDFHIETNAFEANLFCLNFDLENYKAFCKDVKPEELKQMTRAINARRAIAKLILDHYQTIQQADQDI